MSEPLTGRTGTRSTRFLERRVLVVDDDPTFVLLATETLQQGGFELMSAATVQEALTAFATFVPDLVLLDVGLPGGSGYDVCRSIRESATNSDIPVLLVTGHNDTASIEASYEAGATDFMPKPVLWPTLPHRVDFMLRALDARRGLARSEKRIRTLLQALPDASIIVDRRGCITEHLIGSDTGNDRSLVGSTLEEAFPVALAAAARRCLLGPGANVRSAHEFAVGQGTQQRWFEARFRPQLDGTLLIVARDTTERRRARARIEYLAFNDVLTGLPNRQGLVVRATHLMRRATRLSTQMAVLYIDLDRFKRVNDNLGHAAGNELLKNAAQRLQQLIPAAASGYESNAPGPVMVARLGGDEFVVLAGDLNDEQQAIDVAERLRRLLVEPFDCGGQHYLVVTPSIGIAMFPRDSSDIDDLLVKANMAMYRAKEQGGNGYSFFGASLALYSLGRLEMETDMRRAFESRQFRICYQPKLDLVSGEIAGVEALLRWDHPDRGAVSPEVFIPVAEETGLIVPLGEWVVREVCAQLKSWADKGFGRLTAAVNVSVHQFVRHDFVDAVLGALLDTGVAPDRLELEITESLLMRNTPDTRASMSRFRSHGVGLSIDDFGTGYSSLGYLRDLPVSALKIDRSFVSDLERKDDAAKICAAIIALARELRLRVVAEGVETEKQLAFLRRHRCDEAQGFLICRPVPAADLERVLRGELRGEDIEPDGYGHAAGARASG